MIRHTHVNQNDEYLGLIEELNTLKKQLKAAEDQLRAFEQPVADTERQQNASTEDETFDLSKVNDEIFQSASNSTNFKPDQFEFLNAVGEVLSAGSDRVGSAMLLCQFSPTENQNNYETFQCMEQESRNIESIINAATSAGDIVGYISHFERAIFTPVDLEGAAAAHIAERIIRALGQHKWPKRNNYKAVKCSIGIALFPNDSKDIATLFRFADRALYNASKLDDSYYSFYLG